jgi:hypothetical protein
MHWYIRESTGWDAWDCCIGIRADEKRRAKKPKIVDQIPLWIARTAPIRPPRLNFRYPLIEWGICKPDILDWWAEQSFDLGIEEFEGSCQGCFKKSFAKHNKQIDKDPTVYDWHREMEAKYENGQGHTKPDRFFRGGLSVDQLFELHRESHGSTGALFDPEENGGCSESCEFVHTERRVKSTAKMWRTKAYRPRPSRLTPWFDQLGTRPHAEIAREAGVSPSTVYQMAARKAGKELRSLLR